MVIEYDSVHVCNLIFNNIILRVCSIRQTSKLQDRHCNSRIISVRGEIWAHKTSFTASILFLKSSY